MEDLKTQQFAKFYIKDIKHKLQKNDIKNDSFGKFILTSSN